MSKTLIGKIDDFKNYKCTPVELGRKKVLIWRSNGELYATQDKCPHQGASLECETLTGTMIPSNPKNLKFGLEGLIVRCPWHKWEYDVSSGQSVFETDNGCLKTYKILIEDDLVYLDV